MDAFMIVTGVGALLFGIKALREEIKG